MSTEEQNLRRPLQLWTKEAWEKASDVLLDTVLARLEVFPNSGGVCVPYEQHIRQCACKGASGCRFCADWLREHHPWESVKLMLALNPELGRLL